MPNHIETEKQTSKTYLKQISKNIFCLFLIKKAIGLICQTNSHVELKLKKEINPETMFFEMNLQEIFFFSQFFLCRQFTT